MNAVASGVGAFVALLGAAVVVSILAERLRVPVAVALVAVGTFVHVDLPFAFGDVLLFVFLPPLVFEAAWNLDLGALRRTGVRIAMLAVPGTLATAALVAGALIALGIFTPGSALVFGAIVSATDPVAVVAAFRRVDVPLDVRTLVEGESLANDGVALVLFALALAFASGASPPVGVEIAAGIAAIAIGIAVGVVFGLACAFALRATDALEYEVTVTIVLAYLAYVAAAAWHGSGLFATAAGAVALRAALARMPAALTNAADVDRAWIALAFIANAVVFLATGILIQPQRIVHEPVLVIAAVGAVWLARALLALVAGRSRRDRVTLFLAGMRGALPLALALGLPATLPGRPQIIDATFAVVLITIVAQGAPLQPVLARLYRRA